MIDQEVLQLIDEANEMLPSSFRSSQSEIEKKASHFLFIQSRLVQQRRTVEYESIKTSSLKKAKFIKTFNDSTVKTIQERKLRAENDGEVLSLESQSDELDADINYLNTYIRIFENAHIFYRQQLKQEG